MQVIRGGNPAVQATVRLSSRRREGHMEVDIDGDQVILREVKLTLVLPKTAFIEALKRGKSYTRAQAMQARLARLAQEPRGDTSQGVG